MATPNREPWADVEGDPDGDGYQVVDQREHAVLAWRGHEQDAHEIAELLNERYPSTPPAPDTLVHEIRCERIAGRIV